MSASLGGMCRRRAKKLRFLLLLLVHTMPPPPSVAMLLPGFLLSYGTALCLRGPVSVCDTWPKGDAAAQAALDSLVQAGDSLVTFQDVMAVGHEGWVHVASAFPELVSARRAGAATVWLNERAAATDGDLESQGYIGTAIIGDFADAVCAGPSELSAAVDAARRERWNASDDKAASSDVITGTSLDDATREESPTDLTATEFFGDKRSIQFCMQCGTKLPITARFCRACGERLDED